MHNLLILNTIFSCHYPKQKTCLGQTTEQEEKCSLSWHCTQSEPGSCSFPSSWSKHREPKRHRATDARAVQYRMGAAGPANSKQVRTQPQVQYTQLALLWIHARSLENTSNLLLNFQKSCLRMTPAHPRDLLKPVFLPDMNGKGLKLTSNQNLLFTDLSLPCSSFTFHDLEVCTDLSSWAMHAPSSG